MAKWRICESRILRAGKLACQRAAYLWGRTDFSPKCRLIRLQPLVSHPSDAISPVLWEKFGDSVRRGAISSRAVSKQAVSSQVERDGRRIEAECLWTGTQRTSHAQRTSRSEPAMRSEPSNCCGCYRSPKRPQHEVAVVSSRSMSDGERIRRHVKRDLVFACDSQSI